MQVILTNDNPCCFELTPTNERENRRMLADGREPSVLFQTDWDFPGLARNLGWNGKIGRERCQHRGTDGTITCPACGLTAGDFISAASEWLHAHVGQVFRKDVECYFG